MEGQNQGLNWVKYLDYVRPYVFKIETSEGSGTGFQILFNGKKDFYVFATALHVVRKAHDWKNPIKMIHSFSRKEVFLYDKDRIVFTYPRYDLAILAVRADLFNNIPITKDSPDLVPPKIGLVEGVPVGWCGFPSVSLNNLCFFSGNISCRLIGGAAYFVDGVAINGVSGGPVFTQYGDKCVICGVVTAYHPNISTGKPLPGLAYVVSVEPYQKALSELRSFGEVKKQAVDHNEDVIMELAKTPDPETLVD